MNPLVFLDIETTGLNPDEHEILEVAYIRETDDGWDETHFSLAIDLERADDKALAINRYYEREPELAKVRIEHGDAAEALVRDLKDYLIVANNPTFDIQFMRRFILDEGLEPTWFYRPIDLNSWVSGIFMQTRLLTTAGVADHSGVVLPLPEDQHTALADARWNKEVYTTLADNIADMQDAL